MYGTPKTRLSPQAITLWYKPPELLLGASEYSSAADIWSVGCIFAELLLRRPFLQGNMTDISQLDKIFEVFGTPNDTNWPDYNTLPLCTRGLEWDNSPPIHSFEEIFIAAPQDCISLLRSMLVLDPNKRFTADQCLSHPYFMNDPPPTPKEKLVLSSDWGVNNLHADENTFGRCISHLGWSSDEGERFLFCFGVYHISCMCLQWFGWSTYLDLYTQKDTNPKSYSKTMFLQ